MPEWPRKFSKAAAWEVASQVLWAYWPYWGAPVVSALLAYTGGYSPTIIFMVALGAFAIIAISLNNFAQWRSAQSPSGKVDFIAPWVGVKNDDTKSPPQLHGLKLGAVLRSTAIFPMEIRIDDLETQIGDRVPTQAFYVRSVTVTQGMTAQFGNSLIDLSSLERANQVIYGRIKASVMYGRPGRLNYPAVHQWYMAFKFDGDGNLATAEPSLTEFAKENGG